MLTVNGITFQQGSAFDHATSMLNYMNALLQEKNLPTLEPNNGNALWWTLLAQGSFASEMDKIVVQAANSLNIESCDDNQVLNLLPIAGTSLLPATPSVVSLTAIASSGILFIPSGTLIHYGNYDFATLTPLTVPLGSSGSVQAYCTQNGPITVPDGDINLSELTGIAYLSSITNTYAAIPGSDIETPSQARVRIIAGKSIGVGIDGAITALNSLPGVGQANVYWNPSVSVPLAVPGLSNGIPPRCAWILVQGFSPYIAETYLKYMTLPTSGTNFLPQETQNYVTLSGQQFGVRYDLCEYQEIYTKVYVDSTEYYQNGYETILRDKIIGLNSSMKIGQRVSSEFISAGLSNFQQAKVLGATVSLAVSGTYGQVISVDFNNVPFFTISGISVELQ